MQPLEFNTSPEHEKSDEILPLRWFRFTYSPLGAVLSNNSQGLGMHTILPCQCIFFVHEITVPVEHIGMVGTWTTDTQWRHKSKISEKLGRCGRQNMLPAYLKIWEWEWILGRAVKAISSLGVRSPCTARTQQVANRMILKNWKMNLICDWFSISSQGRRYWQRGVG